MIRKLLLVATLCLFAAPALAQNTTCPTRANGDSSNACASTAFVQNAFAGGSAIPLTQYHFLIGNSLNKAADTALGGDCTYTTSYGIVCTKTNNVAFGGMATQGVTAGGDLTGSWPSPTIASGAVTSGKMAAGAAAANVGTLGGDLSGTLPNPTVAKVQGLAYKSAATYTSGQVPTWNSTNSDFEPGSGGGGGGGGPWVDVTAHSVLNDGKYITDGVCNATTTFTSATANFVSGDVGKAISAEGCGSASGTLVTTIASVTNSTTVVLAAAASVSAGSINTVYGTDNTTALNTLIATYPDASAAVTLYFPAGIYVFTGQVTFTNKYLEFRGTQYSKTSGGANGFNGGGTTLAYINTGSGNFLYGGAQTGGVLIHDFNITWTSATYTGTILTFVNDGAGDPGYNSVRDNTFNGNTFTASNTCISANKTIATKITNNSFWFCGLPVSLGSTTGYCNGCSVDHNFFYHYITQAIYGCLSGGSISSNTIEMSRTNFGQAWVDANAAAASSGVQIANNWLGDGSVATAGTAWFQVYGNGINFIGNYFGGTQLIGIALYNNKGFMIMGNTVNGTYTNFIDYLAATVDGGMIIGNSYHGVTTFEANTTNKGTNTASANNVAF